ncbi:hypothetical protein NMG60_11002576 [Bertholletia excelsa]
MMEMEVPTTAVSADHTEMEKHQTASVRPKGGLVTMPFIIANEALEKVASYGLLPNMILYLMGEYHIGVAKGTNILFFWSAATNFLPLVGAFLSDSFLGRFLTIGLGSIASLLGMILLWLTAMIPQARPPPCNQQLMDGCKSPTTVQHALLISSFALMSIGAGGIRPCSLAFGADQLDKKDNPDNERVLERFFSWYYAATATSAVISFTVIVYVQDHAGWKLGFGIPAVFMFLSAIMFFIASPLYIKQKATMSLFTSFTQVIVVAYKNRKLALASQDSNMRYHQKNDSKLSGPTNKLRFLNKACIIRNPEDSSPWSLCTVEQVEEMKALLRVIPLWSSAIMMSVNVSQSSIQVLQAKSMDRHISSGFQIPPGSFVTFIVIGVVIWVVLYDRVIIPLASKIKGKPIRIGAKIRMGLGLICSFMAMVVSAIVEHFRRKEAITSGYSENPQQVVHMSAMWLVPQYILNGFAEALNAIAQNEFFYSELPKSMSSIASALTGLGLAVGSLLASFILSTVNSVTQRGGKESWISDNINKGHYERYYWLLAILSFVNLFYFLGCSWAYGPCSSDVFSRVSGGREDVKEEELSDVRDGVRNEEGIMVEKA